MNKVFFFLLIVSIQFCAQHKEVKPTKFSNNLSFSSGIATDYLTWNISGNLAGENPNVLSELEWKNLLGINFTVNFETWYKNFGVSINYSNAKYFKGDAIDTDYTEDDRMGVNFFSKLDAKDSEANQLELKVNYKLLKKESFVLMLGIGYALLNQNFKLKDNSSLNSSYQPKWQGLLLNTKAEFELNKINIYPYVSYFQLDYTAKANWNLIADFKQPVSFEHFANGFGLKTGVLLEWQLLKKLYLQLNYFYQYSSTGKGFEKLYLIDDSVKTTRINDVTRRNQLLTLGLNFKI